MRRNIRRGIDLGLTGLGIGIIFTAVLLSASLTIRMQLPLALLGVLLMEAGVWGITAKLFPSQRRFVDLRAEGDNIIQLIRQLNAAAVARDQGRDSDGRFQATLDEMHDSVKRMAELASHEAGPRPVSG
ncbi:MAG: hypothetical protein DHS20C12_19150 [Pseudohongiella sp.]|nr:MAG: hypothetical protein DHS20C12_19150 [Pseudohongiella sp.]